MLGFLIGTACLIGLIKVVGCGRRHGGCGGHARHGWGYGRGGRGGRGFGERAALRWLFERLDTTHGQEKVILEAVEELKPELHQAKSEWRSTFGDLARAMREPEFDHGAVAGTWLRQDKALEQLRLSLTTGLTRIHDVLDERQRRILAEIVESGPRFRSRSHEG